MVLLKNEKLARDLLGDDSNGCCFSRPIDFDFNTTNNYLPDVDPLWLADWHYNWLTIGH